MTTPSKTLLIIDDEPSLRRSVRSFFEDFNFQVLEAPAGKAGIDLFRSHRPDVVLLDLRMPGMDGVEVTHILHREAPDTPLIIVSGTGIIDNAIQAIREGAWDYVTKPILDMDGLKHVVDKNLERAALIMENREYQSALEERVRQRTMALNAANQELNEKEQIFHLLAKGITGITEQELFNAIVRTCADIFHAQCAMIGSLKAGSNTIETYAMISGGMFMPRKSYPLEDTPCQEAISSGYAIHPKQAFTRFPLCKDIYDGPVEGYVGVALKDKEGRPMGVLSAFSTQPMTLPAFTVEILDILASRGSAVLERHLEGIIKKQLLERLQQAQKLEAVGTLAGGIAHDFNNILSPILGYAELLRLTVIGDEKTTERINGIINAAHRAKDLVQQILTISRKKKTRKQTLSIHPILKEAMKMLRSTLPTTIEIRERINQACPPVHADPTQIHQMIMNLCTNAFHAMENKGGVLEVTLDTHTLGADNTMMALPGEYLLLTVSDSGHGIAPDIIERIFDPYFTTKEEGKGTGLGLAVLHGIVSSHGGCVSVDSLPGKGTTFRVYLPIPENLKTVMENSDDRQTIIKGSGHILVVDDQKEVLDVMVSMLSRIGYETTALTDATRALELFRAAPGSFDMVITDQTMPNLPGDKLAEKLLAIRPDLPIVLCSGYTSLISEEQALKIGIKVFESKPIDLFKLAQITHRLLHGESGLEPA
ncbi:MAG: response regulator [Pseudomonadota bacterium]